MEPVKAVAPPPNTRRVWGACPHDCPDTCAMVVDVEDTPQGPKAVRVGGDPSHPVTRGALCAKVNRYLDRTYHKDRLTQPLKRVGAKGEGRFEPISWDEAVELFVSKLKQTVDTHGPQSVLPYSYAGTMGRLQSESLDRRFFHRVGASLLDRTICATAGAEATTHTLGACIGAPPEAFEEAEVIFLWGTNTITSNVHLWPFVRQAQRNGATVVCIDPRRTKTAERCNEHIAPHPGTDAALALGMAHVLFRDDLADIDYLTRHVTGWRRLRERVLEDYAPTRVDAICGLPEGTTEGLAHTWASSKKALLRTNYGVQRTRGGGNAVRAIIALPTITGAFREYAGGYQLSTSGGFNTAIDNAGFQRMQWIPEGTRTINMSRLGEALLDLDDPPVHFLCVYNSNPAAVAPDQNRVTKGLQREDLFTVVLEHFQTDTADYADLVLPATTQLEHRDIHTAYGHYYLTWNEPSIPPIGQALSNTDIFRRIARAAAPHFGWDDGTLHELTMDDDALATEMLGHPTSGALHGITLEQLKERHWMRLDLPERFTPFAKGSPYTADGKIHLYAPELEALGVDPLPTYIPPVEDPDHDIERAARYPLRFISPPAHHFLNTTFVNVLQQRERDRPWLEIHPLDAAARHLKDGATCVVHNDRGRLVLDVVVTDATRPGTVVAPSVWWRRQAPDGNNANVVTSERLTDIGRGATFYDVMVQVEPA